MTEKSTKTFIGAFVLGAIALLVGFIILLGSGVLSGERPTFVLYFNTSLKGLTQGSPVYFKGIRIGAVKSIQIRPDLESMQFSTPVIIEIEKDKAMALVEGGEDSDIFNDTEAIKRLIQRGLRARLGLTSILTGQLCVELDILPHATPVDLATLTPYHNAPQIPTQLSSLDAALSTLENIPLQEVLYDMVSSIKNVSQQLQSLDINGLMASFRALSDDARARINEFSSLKDHADDTLSAYTALASSTQRDLHRTLDQVNRTLERVNALTDTSSGTMSEMRNAMFKLSKGADNAASLFSEDSAPVVEFGQTMLALRKAAQALSDLAVLLEIKPNSLIFGRNNR